MARKEPPVQTKARDTSAIEEVSAVTPEDLAAVLKVLIGSAAEVVAGAITKKSGRPRR